MNLTKVYYDSDGCSGNILQIVKREPEWAANRIQEGERALENCSELLKACKRAAWLYDQLALSPLDAAAKYGPDYLPPTDEQCLEIREAIHNAIVKAESKKEDK